MKRCVNKGQVCKAVGCNAEAYCKERCNRHYQRMKLHGRDDILKHNDGTVWRESVGVYSMSRIKQRRQGRGWVDIVDGPRSPKLRVA